MMIDNPLGIENTHRPLLEQYPGVASIPFVPLMDGLPTPVEFLEDLSAGFKGHEIWIKRDDLTSSIYGGNKPRKFEFLFAQALVKGKDTIMTAGGVGTNHGLATALFAKELGLKAKIFMFDQPLTWSVQRKLLMYHLLGADIELVSGYGALVLKGITAYFKKNVYIMLPGGSPLFGIGTVAGTFGFINAALELKEQVDAGKMQEPDFIFVPAGSTGTASGLVAGCKLVGLKTKVVAVGVSESIVTNPGAIERNARSAVKTLRKVDGSVPNLSFKHGEDFLFMSGYLGSAYGAVTRKSQEAVDRVHETEGKRGFHLETTYTGKTCAAMFDAMESSTVPAGSTVLFWNTYNSRDLTPLLEGASLSLENLPAPFHKYFDAKLTCWDLKPCPEAVRRECKAYLASENRCWLVKKDLGLDTTTCEECETKALLEKLLCPEDGE